MPRRRNDPSFSNQKNPRLIPQKLRQSPSLENLTDEQALQAIDAIEQLCILLYEVVINSDTDADTGEQKPE
jgi:hypothetical protein